MAFLHVLLEQYEANDVRQFFSIEENIALSIVS
jgi:hypothetical protein